MVVVGLDVFQRERERKFLRERDFRERERERERERKREKDRKRERKMSTEEEEEKKSKFRKTKKKIDCPHVRHGRKKFRTLFVRQHLSTEKLKRRIAFKRNLIQRFLQRRIME